jgi:hypothetical protein
MVLLTTGKPVASNFLTNIASIPRRGALMPNNLRGTLFAVVLVLISSIMIGCFDRFPDSFFIAVRPAVATVDKPGRIELAANCLSGEQLLGGAYSLIDGTGDSTSLAVTASYPSSGGTWTVVVDPPTDPAFWTRVQGSIVIDNAYCLTTPNYPLDLVTVAGTTGSVGTVAFPSVIASCPPNSVLTGGGYQTQPVGPTPGIYNSDLMMSAPTFDANKVATGWQVKLAYVMNETTPETKVFARCARKNLSQGTVVEQTLDLTKLAAAFDFRDVASDCPPNTFTTAGGYWLVGDPLIPHPVSWSYAQNQFSRWKFRGLWGYQTAKYNFRPCDPNANPDCAKVAAVAACIPFPNIPVVKVKITSPKNGDPFPPLPGTLGQQMTAPVVFTAQATDEQGAPLTGNSLQWFLNGAPFGTGESFTAPLPAPGLSQFTVRVTATGKTTSASDQIAISAGLVP